MATRLVEYLKDSTPRPPSKAARHQNETGRSVFRAVMEMSPMAHLIFFSAFTCWVLDSFDFFAVSLTVSKLVVAFDRPTQTVTLSITLTLLFRSVGAFIFGLLSDRFGRKYPLVINMVVISALSLGTGFCKTWPEFLAVRSLFGIAMGGIWGSSAAWALESLPTEVRGLYSGIFQEGYAVGYLMAAVVNLTLSVSCLSLWRSAYIQSVIPRDDWRLIFYVAAGISLFAAILRLALPESHVFLEAKARAAASGTKSSSKQYMISAGQAIKANWWRCLYGILLMTGFNFFSHASQDLYPTYLQKGKLLSAHSATIGVIIGNCGAIVGGVVAGYISQYLGRKITILIFVLIAAVFIPLWTLPNSAGGLWAGAFFVQVGVQGAWGCVPILLNEISPPAFRAVFGGLAYQLGNAASSASSQIEAIGGEHLTIGEGANKHPNYAKVMQIFLSVICVYLFIVVWIGPENHGASFENAAVATEKDAGKVGADAYTGQPRHGEDDSSYNYEKAAIDHKV